MQVWRRWGLALGVSLALVGYGSASVEGEAEGIEPTPVGVVQEALSGAMQFTAVADARVESALPTSNFGGSSRLVVDGSPRSESLLRFQVSGVSGTVTRARLRLYVSSGTTDGPAVYATGSTWSESAVTWDTRPARSGGVIADAGPAADGTFVEFDVTSRVRGDGAYNFALVATSSDGVTLSSRNAAEATQRPLLIVDVGDSSPTPTCAALGVAFSRNESISYHDTYVTEAQPTTSFFMRPELRVDGSPGEQSYFRVFTFWPEQARLRSVKLRLLPLNGSSDGPALYFTTNDWTHSALTWNNRPALLGGPIGDAGSVTAGTWLEYDITASARQGVNSYGLVATSSDGADFYSGYQNGSKALTAWTEYEWDYCARQGSGGALHAARTFGGGGAEDVSAVASTPDGHVVMVADLYIWGPVPCRTPTACSSPSSRPTAPRSGRTPSRPRTTPAVSPMACSRTGLPPTPTAASW